MRWGVSPPPSTWSIPTTPVAHTFRSGSDFLGISEAEKVYYLINFDKFLGTMGAQTSREHALRRRITASKKGERGTTSSGRLGRGHRPGDPSFCTPHRNLILNLVAHVPHEREFLDAAPLVGGWISKSPIEPSIQPRKNRATLAAGFITDSNDVVEMFAALQEVHNGFGFISGNVQPDFAHGFDRQGIKWAWFQPRAVSFESGRQRGIQECFSHLAARRIVNAYKKKALFHTDEGRAMKTHQQRQFARLPERNGGALPERKN